MNIKDFIEKEYHSKLAVPKKLKINEKYYEDLIKSLELIEDEEVYRIFDVPIEVDNEVAVFKFVYQEDEK